MNGIERVGPCPHGRWSGRCVPCEDRARAMLALQVAGAYTVGAALVILLAWLVGTAWPELAAVASLVALATNVLGGVAAAWLSRRRP